MVVNESTIIFNLKWDAYNHYKRTYNIRRSMSTLYNASHFFIQQRRPYRKIIKL